MESKQVEATVVEKNPDNTSLPSMEVNVGGPVTPKESKEIVTDDQMIGLYNEILGLIREDRQEINEVLSSFINMVINEGDASTSSKEALVNLMKIKSETANSMSRVMDLLVRVKMRDKSIPGYIAQHQHNEIKIQGPPKRKLLEALAKRAENKKEGK